MCRGYQQNERERLKIHGFYLRLTFSGPYSSPLPDSLTLYYLPRITGSPLEIDGSKIRPDSPVFVTLHRIVVSSPETVSNINGAAVYASRERVKASEGVRFQVYLGEVKILKGVFRREEVWKLECKCVLGSDDDCGVGVGVMEAEVCVAVEGQAAMREKVEMAVAKRKRRRRSKYCLKGRLLEEIPEEREEGESESEGCCCCCSSGGEETDSTSSSSNGGGDSEEEEMDDVEMEMEMKGVRWAVDVGIWVVCLGVGFLVTKAASSKRTRRLTRFL